MDEAKRNNLEIDIRNLSKELGIPVIPASARRKQGMADLLKAIEEVATGRYICKPHKIKSRSKKLSHAIDILAAKLSETFPGLPNVNWVAMRLLEGDNSITEAVRSGEIGLLHEENSAIQN
jgi:ferrous iron transport protein B